MSSAAPARSEPRLSPAAARAAFLAVSEGVTRLEAPLTFASVAVLRDCGLQLIGSAAKALTIDLARVPAVDSAGLALLIDWLASARARAVNLHYANPPPALLALARLSDVEPLLTG